MSRADLALIILLTVILSIAAVSYLTLRYMKYRRALAHGRRHVKPVWRPFWMD